MRRLTVNPNGKFWVEVTPTYRRRIIVGWLITSVPAAFVVALLTTTCVLFFLGVANDVWGSMAWIKMGALVVTSASDFFLLRFLENSFRWHLSRLYMTPSEHATLLERHRDWCDRVDAAKREGRVEPPYPY